MRTDRPRHDQPPVFPAFPGYTQACARELSFLSLPFQAAWHCSNLVPIVSFGNSMEAEHARNVLEQYGITAFVSDANSATTLSCIASGLRGVGLYVDGENAERALEALRSSAGSSPAAAGDWFCGRCHEQVDAGFDLCWSCSRPRTEVERSCHESSTAAPVPVPDELDDGPPTTFRGTGDSVERYLEPYRPPLSAFGRSATLTEPAPAKPNPELEAMLLRAWRASIIGFVGIPLLLQFYSMYLLIRASATCSQFSATGTRRFYQAWAIDVFASVLWGVVFSVAVP